MSLNNGGINKKLNKHGLINKNRFQSTNVGGHNSSNNSYYNQSEHRPRIEYNNTNNNSVYSNHDKNNSIRNIKTNKNTSHNINNNKNHIN